MARNIYDENASNGGSCPCHRITSKDAPRNEYTNSATLISCAAKRGYPATYQTLPTRQFRADFELAQRPASQQISDVHRTASIGYQFNAYSDYARLIDGKPETDPANWAAHRVRILTPWFMLPPPLRSLVGIAG